MPESGGDGAELPVGRVGLLAVVAAPAGDGVVGSQTARMTAADGNDSAAVYGAGWDRLRFRRSTATGT